MHGAAPELAVATLADGRRLAVRTLTPDEAPRALEIVQRAFAARPRIGARAQAFSDDADGFRRVAASGGAFAATLDGEPVGVTLVTHRDDGSVRIGRVGVLAEHREQGVATFLITVILDLLASRGEAEVHLLARREYPHLRRWWEQHGFTVDGDEGDCHVMRRPLPVSVAVPDADAMRALGQRLAGLFAPGDLVIATGDLGAGKTTLTQGIGAGLGVEGPVISPTFVLARVHRSVTGGPDLVHVDAYRLGSFAELDDLDLDASLPASVTLVEWGAGVAEQLASDRLHIDIRRGLDPTDETRWVFLTPFGTRFDRAALAAAAKENP
ncbi:tRNA (adenosine(37)-N6)-threonylcarbamoyltransferase complex ATPase subunit type 1 TsaE [Propioniciclava soli]|uniref:tRNA (adenosine(37)-N6)-threonylcarbamoyltransferase complex ATPase subunit type 1 TsaE n=1 Tax=Propioniciclava soli TaxID=2775081 RepID=UPI002FCCD77B